MKKWLKSLKKDERGLTLVELLAVVVILAIVAAIAVVAIGNVIENSKKDAHISNAQQIITAAKLYEASGGDVNSTEFEDIDTLGDLVDPWTSGDYSEAGVEKAEGADGEYTVTLVGDNCSIAHSETDLRTMERKDICK